MKQIFLSSECGANVEIICSEVKVFADNTFRVLFENQELKIKAMQMCANYSGFDFVCGHNYFFIDFVSNIVCSMVNTNKIESITINE